MINRLSIPEGSPMPQDMSQLNRALAELIVGRADHIVTLAPGVYDLTPKLWTKNNHRHELTVLDNNTGVMRMLPRTPEAGYIEVDDQVISTAPGGRMQVIDDDNRLAILAGGHPDSPLLHIFELIMYAPDNLSRFTDAPVQEA